MEKRLNELIRIAINEAASDIHITQAKEMRLECRVNKGFMKIPLKQNDNLLLNYLQYLTNMDISALAKPQSGTFNIEIDNVKYYCRFALINSLSGRNGVIRIMNSDSKMSLNELVYKGEHRSIFKEWCSLENGLVLFGGPTGAGKTTTAYSMLNQMNGRKIYTLEDPIEVYGSNIIQIQVNPAIGISYDEGIKQLLRHDPDVVMVGEIRDEITARACVRCALTGHLVISTIHAKDCISMLDRLQELGISVNTISTVLKGLANQRLLKLTLLEKRVSIYEIYEQKDIQNYFQDEKRKKEDFNYEVGYACYKNWISKEEQEKFTL